MYTKPPACMAPSITGRAGSSHPYLWIICTYRAYRIAQSAQREPSKI